VVDVRIIKIKNKIKNKTITVGYGKGHQVVRDVRVIKINNKMKNKQ
jgi:hypothetical protein